MPRVLLPALLTSILLHSAGAQSLTTAFTYQGTLEQGGVPADGNFDLRFHLYEVEFGGTPAETLLETDVPVSFGSFTTELDFGDDEINGGDDLWLEIEVRRAGAGSFTTLAPRQRVTAAPYALYARRSGGLVTKQGATIHTGPDGETWFAQPGGPSAHRFAVEPFGGGTQSAQFVVDSQGQVGIGTFDPAADLEVHGTVVAQGRLGIGTSDPVAELEVDGTVVWGSHLAQLSTDQGASIELRGTGTPYLDFSNDSATDFDMRIGLSGDNSLTIEGGRVGIGGTMTNPAFKLDLPNVASPDGRGRANAWVTYSSLRWKERVATIGGATEKLRALRGVEFDWKPVYGGGRGIGFVAEEVGAVLPELVEWEGEGPWAESLNYSGILPVLVEAMKEQLVTIERQQEEIAALKALVCADREAGPCR